MDFDKFEFNMEDLLKSFEELDYPRSGRNHKLPPTQRM